MSRPQTQNADRENDQQMRNLLSKFLAPESTPYLTKEERVDLHETLDANPILMASVAALYAGINNAYRPILWTGK